MAGHLDGHFQSSPSSTNDAGRTARTSLATRDPALLARQQWLTSSSFTHPVAVLRGDSNVKGTVIFEQESESAPTTITYDISGNDPNAKRGFHIHTFGDNTNGCTSAGPHCKSPEIRVPENVVGRREEREESDHHTRAVD